MSVLHQIQRALDELTAVVDLAIRAESAEEEARQEWQDRAAPLIRQRQQRSAS